MSRCVSCGRSGCLSPLYVVLFDEHQRVYGPHHLGRCEEWLERAIDQFEDRYGPLQATVRERRYRIVEVDPAE